LLNDLLAKLRSEGMINDYSFEIEAGSGVVTEKCILSMERSWLERDRRCP
jgi:hypothetical protein